MKFGEVEVFVGVLVFWVVCLILSESFFALFFSSVILALLFEVEHEVDGLLEFCDSGFDFVVEEEFFGFIGVGFFVVVEEFPFEVGLPGFVVGPD